MLPDRATFLDYERRLLDRAADWPGCATEHLTSEMLCEIAEREGIDFATALLYDRIRRSPKHGPFLDRLEAIPSSLPAVPLDATLVIAPGGFYRESPQTGADGRLIREEAERFGCPTAVIPTQSFGHLTANARLIRDWLADHAGERIILVSLSKSAAEMRIALAEWPEVFASVRLWVNLSGILGGSALAGWLLDRPWRCLPVRLLFWYRGYPFSVLGELERKRGSLLDFPLRLPDGMSAIHVVGFPLQRHLSSPLARRGHRRIAPLGPNDSGGIVLADILTWPGRLFPVWGADHYLRPAGQNVRHLIRRVLHMVAPDENRLAVSETSSGGAR